MAHKGVFQPAISIAICQNALPQLLWLSVEHIARANDYSTQSGSLLHEILNMVEQTADEVRTIAAASEEQAATSEEITRNLTDVNEMTETTSRAMQLAAHGLDALHQRSHNLVVLVENMKNTK